jgi:site-specific DNA recombinase
LNTDSLLKQIESINIKKQKLIDSMLEGIISKPDVAMMNEKYDKEIDELKQKVKEIEEANISNQKQADMLKSYIDRINEIVDNFENYNPDELYKKTVEKVIIHKGKILEVYFTCLVSPIKVRYNATGKLDYKIRIDWLNSEQF